MRGRVESYETKTDGRRWSIRYDIPPHPDSGRRRQRRQRGFATKDDAERALRKALGALDDGLHVDPSQMTVATYLRTWLAGTQVRPTTAARYRQSVERHIIPEVGGIRLQQLTVEDLDAAYQSLISGGGVDGAPLSPKTVRNAHGVVRTALRDALRRGHVVRNVAEHARLPRLERPEMKVWTAAQVGRFLDHVQSNRFHAMWTLYVTTGMRRGEVIGLRWSDLELEAARLVVQRSLTVAAGRMVWSEPKTARGRRVIALDAATVSALRRHRTAQAEEKLAAGPAWQDDDLVFCWPDGSAIQPQLPTKWIREHAEAAGLPKIRLHDLRHTWATLALGAGVPAKVVSERLGHANVSITLDVYTHVSPALDQDAADTVAAAIFGA